MSVFLQIAAMCLAPLLGGGAWWGCLALLPQGLPDRWEWPRGLASTFLLSGLLALLAWAYVVGVWQLAPPHEMLRLPQDWQKLLLHGGLCQAASLVMLLWALRCKGGLTSAWLICAGWLGWAEQGRGFWLPSSPFEAQMQLMLTLLIAVCLLRTACERPWGLGLGLVLALQMGLQSPHWGSIGALVLVLAPPAGVAVGERAVAALAALVWLVQAAALPVLPLAGLFVAALLWLAPGARWFAALQLALWLGGEGAQYPLWAGLGAALGLWIESLWDTDPQSPSNHTGLCIPWPAMATVLLLGLSFFLLKPGEEWFNRRLLLGAQKARVSLDQLLRPQPLGWWVQHLGASQQMGEEDVALAEWMRSAPADSKLLVVTPQARAQSPVVRRILSELAGRPLWGWEGDELSFEGRQALASGSYQGADYVVVRGPHEKGNLQVLREAGQSRVYQVSATSPPQASAALVAGAEGSAQHLRVDVKVPATLPSRSLVEVPATLTQESAESLDLSAYRGIRLQAVDASGKPALEAPIQPLSMQVGTAPVALNLFLATPELEGEGAVEVELVKRNGQVVKLGAFHYRTWRRLPPIGF